MRATKRKMSVLDYEQVEEGLKDQLLVKNVLGMDFEAFERYKENVIKGLIRSKEPFYYHLAMALRHGNIENCVKILFNWQASCSEYEMMNRIFEAKKQFENEESDTTLYCTPSAE